MTTWMFLLLVTVTGCVATYGRVDGDAGINDIFEAHQVLQGYQYYYNGPDSKPWAILGVKKEYALEQGLWRKVALTPAQLKDWLEGMHVDPSERFVPYGALIKDHEGNEIAIWFSFWNWTTVKRGAGNKVIIYTPPVSIIMDKERRQGF